MKYIKSASDLEKFAAKLSEGLISEGLPLNLSAHLQVESKEEWESFFSEGHPARNNPYTDFTYETKVGLSFRLIYVGSYQ